MLFVYGPYLPVRILEEIRFWKGQEKEHTDVIQAIVPSLEPNYVQLLNEWKKVFAETEEAANRLLQYGLSSKQAVTNPKFIAETERILQGSARQSREFVKQLYYILDQSAAVKSVPIAKTVLLHIIRESEYFLGVLETLERPGAISDCVAGKHHMVDPYQPDGYTPVPISRQPSDNESVSKSSSVNLQTGHDQEQREEKQPAAHAADAFNTANAASVTHAASAANISNAFNAFNSSNELITSNEPNAPIDYPASAASAVSIASTTSAVSDTSNSFIPYRESNTSNVSNASGASNSPNVSSAPNASKSSNASVVPKSPNSSNTLHAAPNNNSSPSTEPNVPDQPVPIGGHTLPPLPYPYNALEPYIDEKTMRIHHDIHHKSYVDGLNTAEKKLQEARKSGNFDLVKHWERELAFNGAGHYLHTIFWEVMNPKGGGKPQGELLEQIKRDFGSYDAFHKQFSSAAEKVEGGGWAILVWSPRSQRLEILTAEKHQNLSQWDVVPLLPLDVWEHAYYLKHQNNRKDYISDWWNVVYWPAVAERYNKAKKLKWQPH
ncbi:Superoxide dismutase [Mn/Fe] [compost metagenome]